MLVLEHVGTLANARVGDIRKMEEELGMLLHDEIRDAPGTGAFTTDYEAVMHTDADSALSPAAYFTALPHGYGGEFVIPEYGIFLKPRRGTLWIWNPRQTLHGTAKIKRNNIYKQHTAVLYLKTSYTRGLTKQEWEVPTHKRAKNGKLPCY